VRSPQTNIHTPFQTSTDTGDNLLSDCPAILPIFTVSVSNSSSSIIEFGHFNYHQADKREIVTSHCTNTDPSGMQIPTSIPKRQSNAKHSQLRPAPPCCVAARGLGCIAASQPPSLCCAKTCFCLPSSRGISMHSAKFIDRYRHVGWSRGSCYR
jgi:hypothetical protein